MIDKYFIYEIIFIKYLKFNTNQILKKITKQINYEKFNIFFYIHSSKL